MAELGYDTVVGVNVTENASESLAAMSRERRRDLIDRLTFVLALCFCIEVLVSIVGQIVVGAVSGPITSDIPGMAVWRWLAWLPALLYLWTVLLALPLPKVRRPDHVFAGGRGRLPAVGRGTLLAFGFFTLWGTSFHSVSYLPEGSPYPASGYVVYVVLGAAALLVLRWVLGILRLLPRSWRAHG